MISYTTNVIELSASITFVKTFSERLRYARELRQLSQKQLAKAAHLSQGAISNYETRVRESSREVLRLAMALQVSPLWLQEGIDPMDLPLQIPSALNDYGMLPNQINSTDWPFTRVMPSTFNDLSAEQKQMIEDMIITLARRNLNTP